MTKIANAIQILFDRNSQTSNGAGMVHNIEDYIQNDPVLISNTDTVGVRQGRTSEQLARRAYPVLGRYTQTSHLILFPFFC